MLIFFQVTNKLETLKRKPSDLRRYMAWTAETKAQYGTMTNYLLQHRLPWGSPPFTYLSSTPFNNPSDFKILINDWPYGLAPDITHIVVWSKTPIPTDPESGDGSFISGSFPPTLVCLPQFS